MGYTSDPVRGFGEYQGLEYGSGSNSAVGSGSPNISNLNGYERQAPHPFFGQEASDEDMESSVEDALAGINLPAGYSFAGGSPYSIDGLGGINDDAFAGNLPAGYSFAGGSPYSIGGLGGINDDAFAGYIGQAASDSDVESSLEEALEDEAFDGYGGLGEGPLQSWHSHFHKASLSNTEVSLINNLAQAVKSVPDDTSEEVRRQYYNLALQMAHRRKKTDLRSLDINRVELESNLGWLVNPAVPKSGGFQAVLNKVVGAVGASMGRDSKDFLKAKQLESYGRSLKSTLRKQGNLAGLGMGFGGSNLKYIGLGVAAVAAYYYFIKK